jgi:hypothetical protein
MMPTIGAASSLRQAARPSSRGHADVNRTWLVRYDTKSNRSAGASGRLSCRLKEFRRVAKIRQPAHHFTAAVTIAAITAPGWG